MLAKLRSRLTYANVMATAAVFIALGGTGYAAITLPKNSVKAKQIAPRAVQSSEAANLTLRDFRRGERAKLKGDKGDTGPQGIQGSQGIQGIEGPPGLPGTASAYAIIDQSTCTTTAGSCTLRRAKNVVAARRSSDEPTGFYCITTGPGIDPGADGFMAGVVRDLTQGAGSASAMPQLDPPEDCPGDFTVVTERPPVSPDPNPDNTVGFWFAVP
jgi:hypothetical protein